ncbi:MAG: Maf family protein, partial [Pseudomonadales bacterium]
MTRLYLASASPRRAALLAQIGVPFERVVPDVDESILPGELPAACVCRLARAKAIAGQRLAVAQASGPTPCTLGA